MENQLKAIKDRVDGALNEVKSTAELEALRFGLFGKKGEFTALLRGLGSLSAEERPAAGALINRYRAGIEEAMEARAAGLQRAEKEARLAEEAIDVTLPGKPLKRGAAHPVSLTLERLVDVFVGMGFEVVEGPEIEYDRYNFELLNVPKNHPARDMQDTFYFNENIVLRTHTSPVQARTMLERKPPIRIICPGRTYRSDDDATHSPFFHQIEGLVIDKGISMGDLKGTLDVFAEALFGEGTKTRFRPSFFPFTEPSAEVDVTCVTCAGGGCRVCKGTGWIEILGSGMVNPKVFDLCGIDSSVYTGFAFGIGIDRVANIRYGIPDIRWLWENDMRFVRQFK